jgi:ATP-binding cassette subfamily F protein uup
VNLINVHGLEKSYGLRSLFRDLNFGIESREKVGLVGPNGVGKSTLLKILEGRLAPEQGQVIRGQGLVIGFLEQEPSFTPGRNLLDALLEKQNDKAAALSKAYELISLLGLESFGDHFPVSDLSGGWKKRVALGRELLLEPNLLLLDEPTNHLDLSGILWLEKFLSQGDFALLMVTHDRLFLQRVCDRILDLDPRNPRFLLDVRGSYLDFTEAKEGLLSAQLNEEAVLKNKLRREKEWLSRGAQARQTKQKARIQEASRLEERVDDVRERNLKRNAQIDFGQAARLPKKLIEAKGLGKSFDHQVLFSGLDLLIRPTTRLGLLGDNGSGKSTLIRCLLGLEKASEGEVTWADGLKVSYFEQNKETLNENISVLKNVCPDGDYVSFQGRFVHVHSYLERFLFFGAHRDLPVSRLSGGERARLRLAQLMLQEAQVLILDEPTNDLDTETLDLLEEALAQFHGAVLLVTHDRYFMDSVCDQLLAFPEMVFYADYFQWEEARKERQRQAVKSEKNQKVAAVGGGDVGKKKSSRLSFKDKYELENMEQTIASLEQALVEAEQSQEYEKMADLQNQIDHKFRLWEELEEKSKS